MERTQSFRADFCRGGCRIPEKKRVFHEKRMTQIQTQHRLSTSREERIVAELPEKGAPAIVAVTRLERESASCRVVIDARVRNHCFEDAETGCRRLNAAFQPRKMKNTAPAMQKAA